MAKVDGTSQPQSRLSGVWLVKGVLLAVATFGVVVIGGHVWRECRFAGIVLESVMVSGPLGESVAAEMVAQQISAHVDHIQRGVAREWRPPGQRVPVTLRDSDSWAIASFLPQRRRLLRISITPHPSGIGSVAAMSISDGDATTRASCDADGSPGAIDAMFECLAVEAMRTIDPLAATSHVLAMEEPMCARFRVEVDAGGDRVAEKKRTLEALRGHCSFKRTRAMAAATVDRGGSGDQPWVSYVYGRLHLARADALAKVDAQAERYEFDRAVSRFTDFFRAEMPDAFAVQMDAYVRIGQSIQESVLPLGWPESQDVIRHRLEAAKAVLGDADRILRKRVEDPGHADAATAHLRGLVLYQRWMIDTHRRHGRGAIGFAEGDEERQRLQEAAGLFDRASHLARPTAALLVDWGTALRALREFDEAVKKFQAAGELAPDDPVPNLKIAVALLERSQSPTRRRSIDGFDTARHAAAALAWVGEGKPRSRRVDNLVGALEEALARADGKESRELAHTVARK